MQVSIHSQILCICMVLSCFLPYVWSYTPFIVKSHPVQHLFQVQNCLFKYSLWPASHINVVSAVHHFYWLVLYRLCSFNSGWPFPVQSSILNTLGVSCLSRLPVVKGRSYCFVFPFCNLISLCSLGLDWLISLEFQALPIQEMCYIQTTRLNSVYRISSSGFYHHHLAMCSSQHKTQHPNIQTLTRNCHTFKPTSFNVWMLGCCTVPDRFMAKYGGDVLNLYSDSISQLPEPGPLYKILSNLNIQPCSVTTSVIFWMWAEQLSDLAVGQKRGHIASH